MEASANERLRVRPTADTAIGSLMETVGTIIAPIRVLINAGLQQLAESLQSVLAPAAANAQSVLQNIGPIMDWVKEKVIQGVNLIIGAFTFLETILTNLGSVWEMAKAYAEMSMIGMQENVMHVLTVAIPEYAKWFGANFVNLIKDAFNAVITVITNAGKIIGDMVYEIFAFIASAVKAYLGPDAGAWSSCQPQPAGRIRVAVDEPSRHCRTPTDPSAKKTLQTKSAQSAAGSVKSSATR